MIVQSSTTRIATTETEVAIPKQFQDIREKIDLLALPVAQEAEAHFPGGRFGIRKYQHMNELADQAGAIAKIEGFTPTEAGLLMLILKGHDIGRHIASLPFEDRAKYIVNDLKSEYDIPEAEAQAKHGILSSMFLHTSGVLDGLTGRESSTVLNAIVQHANKTITLPESDPAYKFAKIAREIDQLDLLNRRDFTTAQGALDQFIQWGAPKFGISKHEAANILDQRENLELKITIMRFLTRVFENSINDLHKTRNELQREERDHPIAGAVLKWFTSPDPTKGLLDPRCLEPLRAYLKGETTELPVVDKNLMTDNYANYMMSHLMIALQIDSASGNAQLLKHHAGLEARIVYLYSVEPKAVGLIKEYVRPIVDIMREKARPQQSKSAA